MAPCGSVAVVVVDRTGEVLLLHEHRAAEKSTRATA